MLNDPLRVAIQPASVGTFDGGSASLSLSTIAAFRSLGGGSVGSSVRECPSVLGCKATLTVSHSSSKENAPYDTARSLVRLDLKKVDMAGKPVNMAVYIVAALPQGGVFSESDCLSAINTLLTLCLLGDVTDAGLFQLAAGNDLIRRVTEGEP